ncbi:T9SS type A sorting domain-containing protein [Flavobacterium hauense]
MKKRLLLGMMLMGAVAANAQITDGTTAPDITGQRILSMTYSPDVVNYGETISLQEYLNQGKTVIVDMSAAWCAPCWSFHNSKTLETLYETYGPEGSDELRVIFIEADDNTNIFELGAQGKNYPPTAGTQERGPSQGDWITGVPYPIINNDTAAQAYGLEGFPSVYTIVPNAEQDVQGKVYNLERDSMGAMVASINAARAEEGLAPLTGIDYYGRINAEDIRYCDADGAIRGYLSSTYGHAITSAQVQLKKDGEIVATQDFTLNIGGYDTGEVDFTGLTIDPTADYQMVLLKVNGQDPLTQETAADFTSEEFSIALNASIEASANIKVVLNTDEYPSEMALFLTKYDDNGQLVGVWSKSFPNNSATYKEKTFTYDVNLNTIAGVTTDTCIGVYLRDAVGDGWDYNTAGTAVVPHGVTITSHDGTVLYTHNGTFGSFVKQDATLTNSGVLANGSFETSSFAVYPNPSNGIFNFTTEEAVDVTVVDLTGKTVHTAKGIENGGSINLSGLQKGMYIAKINGASGERNEKLIIK